MSFMPSVAPDITESMPFLFSGRGEPQVGTLPPDANGNVPPPPPTQDVPGSQVATLTTFRYDVSIGGVPFLMACSDQRPYVRQSAPIQKQQFDTSHEPGEQTLDQFWIRSQTSWHRGAGIAFYDPGASAWRLSTDEETAFRFDTAVGVDVWTQGQVTLLKRLDVAASLPGAQFVYATTAKLANGSDVSFTNESGTVKRRTATAATSYTGGTGTTAVALTGSSILVGYDSGIYKGDANGSTLAPLWTGAASAVTPYWVKSRIIATRAADLYELTLAGGTLPAPMHTHPDVGWTWTSVAESPSAILAGGHGGGRGAIYRFALEDAAAGSLPQLGQAYQVAEFPPGEEVHAIRTYLGRYIAIGTSKGVRVGMVADNGDLQYGPLIVETAKPVRSFTARDTFIYAGVEDAIDGKSGVVRINLAESVNNGLLFAWAWDAQAHVNGQVDSVAFLGSTDRLVVGVRGTGVYMQSADRYEAGGYLLTGRIRYATTEPKLFRRLDLKAKIPGGGIGLTTVSPEGAESFLLRMAPANADGNNITLSRPSAPVEYLSLKLAFDSGATNTVTPVLESYAIKALPVPKRQRMVQFPLLCADREIDSAGLKFGHEGYAWERVKALEKVEEDYATVQCTDFATGETFDAVIDSLEFNRDTPRGTASGNFGGFLKVTVRRL